METTFKEILQGEIKELTRLYNITKFEDYRIEAKNLQAYLDSIKEQSLKGGETKI